MSAYVSTCMLLRLPFSPAAICTRDQRLHAFALYVKGRRGSTETTYSQYLSMSKCPSRSLRFKCVTCASQYYTDDKHIHSTGPSVERNDAADTGPLVSPSPEFTPEQAVRIQLQALSNNDSPRPDHGLEVLYYFANIQGTHDGGALPRYFGFASDLYHFGHFALKVKTRYPDLLRIRSFALLEEQHNYKLKTAEYFVAVVSHDNVHSEWRFSISLVPRGSQGPVWLTTSILPAGSKPLSEE